MKKKKGKKLIFSFVIFTIFISVCTNTRADYILNEQNEKISIAKAFVLDNILIDLGNAGDLNKPSDIFIDDDDNIYIADTLNNRIVKLDNDRNVQGIFTAGGTLLSPAGVYVLYNGDVFVADKGNERIVHLSRNDEIIEQFTMPDSELLKSEQDFKFSPQKIYIGNTGYLYVVVRNNLMSIDPYGEFQGYIATSKIEFSLTDSIKKIFYTREKIKRMKKPSPAPVSDFMISNDGIIYAVSTGTDKNQIKRLNWVGENTYREALYGEFTYEDDGNRLSPVFTGVALDDSSLVYASEARMGYIYVYDQEGNNICVFGGKGNKKGTFGYPISIDVDSSGKVYVLDQDKNCIHIFKPTTFMQTVKSAVEMYMQGKYKEAMGYWETVLLYSGNYPVAYKGQGKTYYKEEDYIKALTSYEKANDKVEYSKVFKDYRNKLVQEWFFVVIFAIFALIIALVILLNRLKKYVVDIKKNY